MPFSGTGRRRALLLAGGMVMALAPQPGWSAEAEAGTFTIGTGPAGGIYDTLGAVICRLYDRGATAKLPGCQTAQSIGSVANLSALSRGEIAFAIVQSDVANMAYRGTGIYFDGRPFSQLRSVFATYVETLNVMVRSDGPIDGLAGLPGTRIAVGPPGSGSLATTLRLFAFFEWTDQTFADFLFLSPEEQVTRLCDGEIDAGLFVSGHPSGYLQTASQTCGAMILPVDGPLIRGFLADQRWYARAVVPGRLYAQNPQPVTSFGPVAIVVTTAAAPPAVVTMMLRAVGGNLRTLNNAHPALAELRAADLPPRRVEMPPHPAAATHFKSRKRY